jgi:hypothetical protein
MSNSSVPRVTKVLASRAAPWLGLCVLVAACQGGAATGDPGTDAVFDALADGGHEELPGFDVGFEVANGPETTGDDAVADAGTALDANTAVDASTQTDGGSCTTAGCPCLTNATCDSGYCVELPAGQVCAQPCVADCPAGLACKTVTLTAGGDSAAFCVAAHPRLCEPCTADADCSAAAGAAQSLCAPYVASNGALVGAFCATACAGDGDCPSGYGCQELTSVDGKKGKQCRKLDLQCDCDGRAIKLGLKTTCSSANTLGKCSGSRACSVGGLTACSAPAAISETCNELDDDCDGKTDEADPGMCDDGSTCTYDNCVSGACQHPPATGDCDDASACTKDDLCVNGKCVGDKVVCDDGNPCTSDACEPKAGCVAKPQDGGACADGSVCTFGDTCKGGVCLPGAASPCDDGNP